MIPEVEEIKNAANVIEAGAIRNRVAAAADRKERPMADWDEAVAAFCAYWNDAVIESHREAARSEARIYGR